MISHAVLRPSLSSCSGSSSGTDPGRGGKRIAFVWSGGTEGVLSPHATIFTRSGEGSADGTPRLTMGMALSRKILPEEVVR